MSAADLRRAKIELSDQELRALDVTVGDAVTCAALKEAGRPDLHAALVRVRDQVRAVVEGRAHFKTRRTVPGPA